MGLFDIPESRLAALEARVAALEGGVVVPPVTYIPSNTLTPASGDTVAGKSFTDLTYGVIWAGGQSNVRLDTLLFDRCSFGMKLGSGAQSSGLDIKNIVARDCRIGMFVASVSDSTFTNLDLHSLGPTGGDHAIYLERDLHRLTFRGFKGRLTAGAGYCLHLYHGGTGLSDDLLFEDVVLDASAAGWCACVTNGYKRVTIRNLTMTQTKTDLPCITVANTEDLLIDGFTAEGGGGLIGPFGGASPQRVTMRNGTYKGTRLPSFPWLTLTDVTLVS